MKKSVILTIETEVFMNTINVLYFATFKDNEKVKEIKQNRNVAFTTIPQKVNEHIKARGIALRSEKTVFDLADCFCGKIPGYKNTIDFAGDSLILYEIHFKTATVTLDLSDIKAKKREKGRGPPRRAPFLYCCPQSFI